MRVVLLNPPGRGGVVMVKEGRCMQRQEAWGYVMAPVTMVTIATLLRDHGHELLVLDCPAEGVDEEAMLAEALGFEPELILVNTSTPSFEDDLHATGQLKAKARRPVFTALYGIHPSCQYQEALEAGQGVDCVIIGEPEFAARDLAEALASGAGAGAVSGLAFLDDSGRVELTAPRPVIADLDALPIPDWSFVDTGNYRLPLNDRRFLLVATNRGCPYRCSFCNAFVYYGRTPRRRSVAHVMADLRSGVERFGVNDFMFWAEEFVLDKAFVMELCAAMTASGLPLRWVCNSRVDAVDAEILAAMRRAGCWNIAYGIESGCQEILDAIGKGTTTEQAATAVRLAKEAGLQVTGHVILGFPADTRETLRRTERFVRGLDLDFVQYYCAMPYPGTRLHAEATAAGWITSKDWREWEHNRSVLDYGHLGAAEIMRTRRRMLQRHYFHPWRAARTVGRNVRSPADLMAFLSKVRGFVRWM